MFFRPQGSAEWQGPCMFEVAVAAQGWGAGGGAMLAYRLASASPPAAAATVWGTLSGYVPSCPMPSGDYYAFLLQVNLSPSRFSYQE